MHTRAKANANATCMLEYANAHVLTRIRIQHPFLRKRTQLTCSGMHTRRVPHRRTQTPAHAIVRTHACTCAHMHTNEQHAHVQLRARGCVCESIFWHRWTVPPYARTCTRARACAQACSISRSLTSCRMLKERRLFWMAAIRNSILEMKASVEGMSRTR
eukprot:6171926-Pleurochrysis_carterae.AAC.1